MTTDSYASSTAPFPPLQPLVSESDNRIRSNNSSGLSDSYSVAPFRIDTSSTDPMYKTKSYIKKRWKRFVGLLCLAATVILWTTSNFLASNLFADDTYSKPFFVTYINTAFFIFPLFPIFIRQYYRNPKSVSTFVSSLQRRVSIYKPLAQQDSTLYRDTDTPDVESANHILPSTTSVSKQPLSALESSRSASISEPSSTTLRPRTTSISTNQQDSVPPRISDEITPLKPQIPSSFSQPFPSVASTSNRKTKSLLSTARLSLEFCFLWFSANYFTASCLSYTTVASSTILTSTSSVFTLIFGVLLAVESFSIPKLIGVIASLSGIILISSVDLSGESDETRGSFPHKSIKELGVGDAMALISAVLYGIYAVIMKKRMPDEKAVNMPLFFGLVGLFNVLLLWPVFFLLHYTRVETFQMPPGSKVWNVIIINSVSSLFSDFTWAYAVVLTSPLIVTVGMSLTIPLSLIGQVLVNGQTAGVVYWIGATIVVASFVIVSLESEKKDNNDDNDVDEGFDDADDTNRLLGSSVEEERNRDTNDFYDENEHNEASNV